MSRDALGRDESPEKVRAGVAAALRLRCAEIEEAIFTHFRDTLPDQIGDEDAEYVTGLRVAVAAAVDYGLTGIVRGEVWSEPIPSALIVQARRAARGGVGLDTVLRRYIVGHTLLGEFVMDEAERVSSNDGVTLRRLRRTQAALLGRLTESIAAEYLDEIERARRSSRQHLAERVQRLLAGEPVDTAELGYELDGWHLGVIAIGAKAERVVRGLAAELGRGLLAVSRGEETVWAWFGDQRSLAVADIGHLLLAKRRAGVSLAIGEPGRGVKGFRLTHRQAQAALLVALRRPQWVTRYRDVALLAFALRDELLARSLVDLYLPPLGGPRESGLVLRQTLRAYFAAERNASSAAEALNVSRHTIENRIHKVEERLKRYLPKCAAELEVALRLEELGVAGSDDGPRAQ